MRVAVEFALEARVFGTNHERGAYLTGRTGVHGSDGGVVYFAESHRSIVAVHHQEGNRIEIGADQARRSGIGSTFRRDDAFKQVQLAPLLQHAHEVQRGRRGLRVGRDDAAADALKQVGQRDWKPRVVWRDLARRARLADRAGQRHLSIRHQLLVVLKAKVLVVGGIGRRSYGPHARNKLWIS